MKLNKVFASLSVLVMLISLMGVFPAVAASGVVRQIPNSGTTSPITGEFVPSGDGTQLEFPAQENDEFTDAYNGIIDRSLSNGTGHGASVNSGKKAKSNPQLNFSFEGLNHYQQRYSRGGNQFSLEPPDQGLCVGNGYVVEATNDVFNAFNSSGVSQLPDNTSTNIVSGHPRNVNHTIDLNSFLGYPAAVNRSVPSGQHNRFGQFVTDPSCLYDAATGRFFLVVLTLDTN